MRSTSLVLPVLISVALSITACQRDAAPAPDTASQASAPAPVVQPEAPAPGATAALPSTPAPPPPPLPEGTDVTYHCDDGNELTVTYTYATADLRWPDGRVVKLTRAATAGKGAGDGYSGHKVSLQHDGNTMQLRDGSKPPATCSETQATA